MQITQVTFMTNNKKCTSIKPKRYLINTVDLDLALEVANERLKLEKHHERYIALTPVIVEIFDV
tara:strand:- start:8161 stop:8352 length:192 start_codon:yes stop_codon:yes gene_type:complete